MSTLIDHNYCLLNEPKRRERAREGERDWYKLIFLIN